MMMLRGYVLRQTEKAVYFGVVEDEFNCLKGKNRWFPKSKIRQTRSRDKKFDVLRMADWLYDAKKDESDEGI